MIKSVPIVKRNIKVGDKVILLTGWYKGCSGKVTHISPEKRAIVTVRIIDPEAKFKRYIDVLDMMAYVMKYDDFRRREEQQRVQANKAKLVLAKKLMAAGKKEQAMKLMKTITK